MFTRLLFAVLLLPFAVVAQAHDETVFFHALQLELQAGEAAHDESLRSWDLDGWMGGDHHKLRLKSEGEESDHDTESSEAWALYSYNIDTFWDVQAGIRYDNAPSSMGYFVAGVAGLAPYHIETDLHLFLSEDGDASLRWHADTDFLLTQQFILQPYIELNAFAQDVDELDAGSGLANAESGVQLRYEITRKIAPYVAVSYQRLFGGTADIAVAQGNDRDERAVVAGIRVMF